MSVEKKESQKRKVPGEKSGVRSLRTSLADQLSCLQRKHTAEMDMLDDIKNFLKQRSELEKNYSQALQKLCQTHTQRRKHSVPPTVDGYDRSQHKGVIEVWHTLVEATEKMAVGRQKVADDMLEKIVEENRQHRKEKEATFKRQMEMGMRLNGEVLESVKDVMKCKKSYHDLEKVTTEARQKYMDVETRLKKKDLKLFESMATLEKSYSKSSERLKDCQKRSTVARNEYLLSLSGTNAHLNRFYTDDLQELMKNMDGPFYDRVRLYYSRYAEAELDLCSQMMQELQQLQRDARLVSREYVLSCFLHKFPMFSDVSQYRFEPYGQDQVSAISRDHGAEIYLDKQARKWANELIAEEQQVTDKSKAVRGLRSVSVAYTKNPEFGTPEATTEAAMKIDELQDEIRHAEVTRTMIEAKMDLLRQGGVDVEKWISKARESSKPKQLLDVPATTMSASLGSLDNLVDIDRTDVYSNSDPFESFDNLSIASTGSSQSTNMPKLCTALYSYTARHSDELNITEGEVLDVIDWDDGEGWTKGRNKYGHEGYFPQSYVQPCSRPPSPRTNGYGSHGHEQTDSPESPRSTAEQTRLRALFDYEAASEEELSFPEGAVIELLRTDDNGVDDGWWEGRYQGKVGVFPSIVVEVLDGDHIDGHDVHSDSDLTHSAASSTADSTSFPPPLGNLPPPPPPESGLDDTLTSDRSAAYVLSKESSFQHSFVFDSFDEDDLDGLV